MKKIRKHVKKIALLLVSIQLLEMLVPLQSFALTGGPSVPEVQQFNQADETNLVNLFTGDFNYSIPLLDVGGYPISISYNSDAVKMETEASNVGLGWNLNIGSISRDVRGLPDDFNGEMMNKVVSMKPQEEGGASLGFDVEVTGFGRADADAATKAAAGGSGGEGGGPGLGGGIELGISRSTYDGWEIEFGMNTEAKISGGSGCYEMEGSLSNGFTLNNKKGSGLSGGASFSTKLKDSHNSGQLGLGLGLDVNSREGIEALNITTSFKGAHKARDRNDVGKVFRTRTGGHGLNFGFPISFSSPTFNPYWEVPRNTGAVSWRLKLGGEVPLTHLSGTLKGFYSKNYIQQNRDSLPAYGYIYSQNSSEGKNVLDFNREKDRGFSAEVPNLPVTQFTYDVYTVNGQGVGGSFRPFRSDCGTLHDPYNYQNNTAGTIGGEIGAGQLVKGGIDVKVIYTHSESKKWSDGNSFNDKFDFKKTGTPAYEPVYFKNLGEATGMANPEQFQNLGGFKPFRAEVNNNATTTGKLLYRNGEELTGFTPENVIKHNRESRNTLFSYMTAEEASHNGFDKFIKNYPVGVSPVTADRDDVPNDLQYLGYARNSAYRKNHHLSEITVTRPDGARYVYGLPAYSVDQKDVTFNISGRSVSYLHGSPIWGDVITPDPNKLVSYSPGTDNTTGNFRGLDHYFESESTPANAYAWMLTNVLSDDYVDLTGNGPSPDDLGNYTKFNYSLVNNSYHWRIPYELNKANFQENNKNDEMDNYANYSYGTKEIWNTHSIETRNFVAEFFYSNRNDGVGVIGENGGMDHYAKLQKLDSIKLYSKSERLEKGNAAVPLKKVVFTYSYDLCKGIPNNIETGQGKLTLTGIYFTYGTSEKGKLSPYQFTYSETNPDYKSKSVDKWGNYIKKEDGEDVASYATLPKEKVDKYASAWLLTSITTPEASKINIDYETDDYAYVQNKTAMEMFTIKELSISGERNTQPSDATEGTVYNSGGVYNFVKFKLKTPTNSRQELERYFDGIQELFFSAQMDVSANHGKFEKVDGFIPMHPLQFGVDFDFCSEAAKSPDGKNIYAWLKLPRLHGGDPNTEEENGMHPMAKAAFQKIRKSMPEMIYDDPDPMTDDISAFVESSLHALESIEGFYRDANAVLSNGAHASRIKLDKSKIRLNTPDMKKFGGGARVKRITVTDEWASMTGNTDSTSTYGSEYFYTTRENLGGQDVEISSGVNSYEPATLADENPFSLPTRYTIEKPLSIDYTLYYTGPVGEIFFPGAGIGYSKVKVRSLQHTNVTKNATGFSTNEFYTAKDFPTVTAQTDLQVNPHEVPQTPFYSEKQFNVSQGFSVELNNMHGQQKAVHVFQETDSINPISGQEFYYKTDERGRLNNTAPVVDPATGVVTNETFGVDYEVYADSRMSVSEAYGPGVDINVDGFMAAIYPITIPMPYPKMTMNMKRYCALTFTKVIHRNGILDRVLSYNNGASASVSTSLYDKQTGEAVVTESENEFGNKEYATNIPAYWLNGGMDAAYKNQGLKTTINSPFIGAYQSMFNEGDELLIHNFNSYVPESVLGVVGRTVAEPPKKAWVLNVSPAGMSLIDVKGAPVSELGTYSVEVLRSGRRNHLNEIAGSVLSFTNPVNTSTVPFRFQIPTTGIINAGATEYSNLWQTYAAFTATQPKYECKCQPFSNKMGTTSKNSLEAFLKTLITSGDFSQMGVSLASSAYSTFSNFLDISFHRGARTYNGSKGATGFTAQIVNSDSTTCNITVEMADHRTLFPDTILDFRIDLSLVDSIDRAACDNAYTALGIITYRGGFNTTTSHLTSGPGIQTARVRITTSCFPILQCKEDYVGAGELTCAPSGSGRVNPYMCGILGNWRKKTDYAYRSQRDGSETATGGTLHEFKSFFTGFESGNPMKYKLPTNPDRQNWQSAGTATVYDPYGRNMESRNSLGIYSSEVFGYGFSLPVLAVQNSRYMNAAFDGFEDYQYKNAADNPWNDCPILPHFKFDTTTAKIDREVSHTGLSSLRTSSKVTLTRNYYAYTDATEPTYSGGSFLASRNNLIQPYTPDGDTCLFSAWISKGVPGAVTGLAGTPGTVFNPNVLQNIGNLLGNGVTSLLGGSSGILGTGGLIGGSASEITIKATTNSGTEIVLASANTEGKSIEGWKQVNAVFVIPPNLRSITVELNANTTTWYDDIRIQPFNSSMKTFVYSPSSLRLMAMLDENNYAAIYEYDNEGNLVRTKKETEDNIVTLQEIRSSKFKTK